MAEEKIDKAAERARKAQNRKTLSALIKPYQRRLQLGFLLGMINACLLLVQCGLISWLFAEWVNEWVGKTQNLFMDRLVHVLPWLLLIMLLRSLIDNRKTWLSQKASLDLRMSLRQRLLASLATLGPARRHFGSDGSLSSQVLDQVDALDGYISRYYVQKQLVVMVPVVFIIATFFFSKVSALILIGTAPLVLLFMIVVGVAAAYRNRGQFKALQRLSGNFLDLVRGMTTLRRLMAGEQAEYMVNRAARSYQRRTMSVLQLAFLSTAVLEFFASIAIALVAVYLGLGLLGALPWDLRAIPVPFQGALFILLLVPDFYQPLRQLGADYHDKAKAEAAVENIQKLLVVQPRQQGNEALHLSAAPSLKGRGLRVLGDGGRLCLARMDLDVAAGERIAVSGPSGSGKSTLLQVLLGFQSHEGQLWINGVDAVNVRTPDRYKDMAYLSQQPPLLRMSIAENMRLAKEDASDEELQKVLDKVGLWSIIARLPEGLGTLLGEQGQGLSGGQLQRMAIAQMLLRDAPLWLLDEPTAHLDPQTADDIIALLGDVSEGKTVIMATHDAEDVPWATRLVQIRPPTDEQALQAASEHELQAASDEDNREEEGE